MARLVPDNEPKAAQEEKALPMKNQLLKENAPVVTRPRNDMKGKSWTIGLTSLFFILLQSACTAFMALSGLRLLIGIGSLAAATAGTNLLASIHGAAIRIPMEIFAIAGSVINLYAIWRVRSLRARPSSQWRVAPVSADKRRAESIQIAIAIVTLLLVAIEWTFHIYLHHSI
jgi:hypothetical protein